MTASSRQWSVVSKNVGCFALSAMLFALSSIAHAQQAKKVPKIGYLTNSSLSAASARIEAFRQGLRDLHYVEGQNISIEWRAADEVAERISNLAAELVQLKVDVIFTQGTQATQAAKNATQTIAIVMTGVTNPVGTGLVASLAHPGGNVTGLSNLYEDVGGKQLELLKEAFPKISRVAVLWDPSNAGNVSWLEDMKVSAGALGIKLQPVELHGSSDIEPAFLAIEKQRLSGLSVLGNGPTNTNRTRIVELAAKSKLPVIYSNREFVDTGGLMSYGPNPTDSYRPCRHIRG